jgi:hypothetical protein
MTQDAYYTLLNNLPQSPLLQQMSSLNLLEKLRNGHVCTDDERHQLSALAQSAEDEITQLEDVISSLKAMKDGISNAAGLARAVIAPIWKIPEEILLEIFAFSGTTIFLSDKRSGIEVAANLLSSVCSAWYKLVKRTASLWTVVDIIMLADLVVSPLIPRVKEVFDKSEDLPLDLSVNISRHIESLPLPLSDLLKEHRHRWKCVTIWCSSMIQSIIFEGIDTLPALRRLELAAYQPSGQPLAVAPSLSIPAPNLRELAFENVDGMRGSPLDCLEDILWNQLEVVTLGVTHFSEYFDALSRCTALKSMSLSGCRLKEDIPYTPLSSNLVSLDFSLYHDTDDWAMGMCFDYLTLPCLREFHVTCRSGRLFGAPPMGDTPSWPTSRFLAFLDRSGCALKTLKYSRFPMSDNDLLTIMSNKAMKTVETFDFVEPAAYQFLRGHTSWPSGMTIRLVQRLRIKEGDASEVPLLPMLQSLKLSGRGRKKEFTFQKFLEMVSSRWRPGNDGHLAREGIPLAALTEVNLEVWKQDVPPSAKNELRRLQSSGLNIRIRHVPGYGVRQ